MLSLGAFSQEATQGILNVPSGLRFMPAEHERHAAQEAPFVTRHALVGPGDSCKIFRQVKDPFHHPYLRADEAVFGLIPSWACDSRSASQNCAVHVAAIANKPVYRSSFLHAQFCWLSVSFFLGSVWKEGREQLVRVEREDQESFYLAGIWSEWALASGSTVLSFCLLMRDCDMQLKAQRLRVGKNATQCYAVLSTETVAGWVDQPPQEAIETLTRLAFPKLRVLPYLQPHETSHVC